MSDREELRRELLDDLQSLRALILRYASGDSSGRAARDRLEREIQVKKVRWRALKRTPDPE